MKRRKGAVYRQVGGVATTRRRPMTHQVIELLRTSENASRAEFDDYIRRNPPSGRVIADLLHFFRRVEASRAAMIAADAANAVRRQKARRKAKQVRKLAAEGRTAKQISAITAIPLSTVYTFL
jgi:hypothetical protein